MLHRPVSLALASLCAVFLISPTLPAQTAAPVARPSIYVDSDSYTSHEDQSADLTGHVKIIRGAEQLTCDKAHITPTKNEVMAEGNVILITPKEYIKAERMFYDFSTKKGIIYNGFIQTGQETIEGEEIYKTGDQEYQATNGSYTSCVNCPPSWKLSGTKIDATVGSYAYITNPMIRVYGVPIFWLPYAAIPIKTERQSGLLPPYYGQGSVDGKIYGESYFWAIDRSQDATLAETYYTNRGPKTGLEYRFASGSRSRGTFEGNFINDDAYGSDPHYTEPDQRYTPARNSVNSITRYSLRYQHRLELPDGWVSNVNLNTVSDTSYLSDFPAEMPGTGDPALENRASLAKNTENTHADIDVDLYQNLLKADPVGQNSDEVHRVPEIQYSVLPTHLFDSDLLGKVDFDYTNFARAMEGYDNTTGTPGFTPPSVGAGNVIIPGDRYRAGQRLLIQPTLSYPINIDDVLDLVPEISFEEADYDFGYSPTPQVSRRFVRASLSARTMFSSVFGNEDTPTSHKYRHEIIPEINYTVVPWLQQDNSPFFLGPVLSQQQFNGRYFPQYSSNQAITEFDNLQFDYADRMVDMNKVTLGITNVLIQKQKDTAGGTSYRQVLRHTLSQSYDFYTAYEPDFAPTFGGTNVPVIKQPWSEVDSLLDLSLGRFALDNNVSYYPYVNAAANTTSVVLKDAKGDAVSLGYSQVFQPIIDPSTGLVINQANLATESEAISMSAVFDTKYLNLAGTINYDIIDQIVTSYSLYSIVKLPGKCWGVGIILSQAAPSAQTSIQFNLPIYFGNGRSFAVGRPPGL